jgi:hypothetical protein
MSYTEKRRKSFGRGWRGSGKAKHDTNLAMQNFKSRSKLSQAQDLHKFASIAPNISVYLKAPGEWDWKGVDTPSKLAELTKKSNVEIVVKDESIKEKPKTHRYKVLRKDLAKKETEKELKRLEKEQEKVKAKSASAKDRENYKRDLDRLFREGKISKEVYERARLNEIEALVKAEPDVVNFTVPIIDSHKLPTQKEIYDKAAEMYMAENFKPKHGESMPETLPTKGELSEEGYLQAAKLDLMTSEDTQASRKVLDYVDGLRQELEKIGFTVEPISGFDSSNLQY